jgi:hypothetical protein
VVAGGRHLSLWHDLPLPHTHNDRALLLAAVFVGAAVLMLLAMRRRPAPFVLAVEGGSLRLPPDTLARYLAAELARDPDVVASRATFTLRGERLRARAWVALRPLAPAAALRERLTTLATAALRDRLGLTVEVREPTLRVLRVRELARYLR